jgi:hypothetical protein
METRKPKTLSDFPKFVVTGVRSVQTFETGYIRFELEGNFDRVIEAIDPHWFWLLFGERGYLTASVKSLDTETRKAVLTCEQKDQPNIIGMALAYLSPYWQAFNVWMVLDPNWGWQRKQFQAADAVAEDYNANHVSIVGGREVRVWTKLEPLNGRTAQSRYYPADEQSSTTHSEARTVPLGWDHEHCELCNAHIDANRFGYCDPEERWMCENCFERYVIRRDLAFVDEL